MAGPLGNARHERFAQELAKGVAAGPAYVLAGFKANDGNAIRLKGNEKVAARVLELQTRAADRAEITQEMVLRELAKIGFADMRKLLKWTGNQPRMDIDAAEQSGEVEITAANFVMLFDSEALDDDTAAAISEISQTKDGALKVKLHDKQAALVNIGKHLGMFKERVELDAKHAHTLEEAGVPEVLSWLAAASGAGEQKPH